MKMRLLIFITLRQLWARRGLNGIAIGGVALGVLVLVGMRAIMQGFQLEFKENILRIADHVVLHDRVLETPHTLLSALWPGPTVKQIAHELPSQRAIGVQRPFETLRMIRSLPQVDAACGELTGQAVFTFGPRSSGVSLHGITPSEQEQCTPIAGYVFAGSWAEFAQSRDGVVLGTVMADNLGVHVGDRVVAVAPHGVARSLKVLGIFRSMIFPVDRSWAFTPMDAAWSVFGRPNAISEIGVRLAQPSDAPKFAARLEALTGYDAESWQELNAGTLSVFSLQNMVVAFQIAAILVVGGFGILAVQIMIVLQKSREIAILRSIGLERRDILRVFLCQGAIIAVLGALVGDFFGWRLIMFLDKLYDPTLGYRAGAQLRVVNDPYAYLWGSAFALALGLAASYLPAWRASRLEPVDVLRGQIG